METARLVTLLLLAEVVAGCGRKVPGRWARLGLPSQGIVRVQDTSDHRFSADYDDRAEHLLTVVEEALTHVGYARTCTQFDGRVRGYSKDSDKLLVKVDSIGAVQALTVGDEQGSDPMLYGVCFRGYQLGPPERLR